MILESILDRFVTPILAVATLIILLMAGCQNQEEQPKSGQPESGQGAATEVDSPASQRPDPAVPQGENLERPEGWVVRLDQPDPDAVIGSAEGADIFFVNMTPGWHVTTHQSAILYHPASTASGTYTAKAGIYIFDPGERQREGYGMLFGGADLDTGNQTYAYFLLRNTGEFLIKQRMGDETRIVQDWTPSKAVKTVEPGGESVLNELSVKVEGGQVHFTLNGETVATHPASDLSTDGIVGLRLNHGVNVHVADLAVE